MQREYPFEILSVDLFFGNFSPSQVGTQPILVSIDGGEMVCYVRTPDAKSSIDQALHRHKSKVSTSMAKAILTWNMRLL